MTSTLVIFWLNIAGALLNAYVVLAGIGDGWNLALGIISVVAAAALLAIYRIERRP